MSILDFYKRVKEDSQCLVGFNSENQSFQQFCGKLVNSDDVLVEKLNLDVERVLFVNQPLDKSVDLSEYSYVLVVVDKLQKLEIDFWSSKPVNVLVEIYVEDDCGLDINFVNQFGWDAFVTRSFVAKNGVLKFNFADLSGVKSQVGKGLDVQRYFNVKNFLIAHSAQASVNWIYTLSDDQRSESFVRNYYQAKQCKGEILVKGIQSGNSNAYFLGEINISLNGGGTDSYLKQDILLLDKDSRVNAIPSLEIKTNDVKAGHGVSISKITEDKLFYLKSRGVSDGEAKQLLAKGFLTSLTEKFSSSSRGLLLDLIESYE